MHGAGRGTETERSGQRRWKRLRKERRRRKGDEGRWRRKREKEREKREGERGFRAEVVHQVYVCSPAAGGTTERKVVSILCNAERQESARIRRGSALDLPRLPRRGPIVFGIRDNVERSSSKAEKKTLPSPSGLRPAIASLCLPNVFFVSCMSAISIVYP